jgi:predicted ATPase/DNA-binding XRE family transcriptional regulator
MDALQGQLKLDRDLGDLGICSHLALLLTIIGAAGGTPDGEGVFHRSALRATHPAHTLASVGAEWEPFAAALRRLRTRSGLTQEQLAERAGLSTNAISALERGERRHPYPHTVRALASALGVDPEAHQALEAAAKPRERQVELPATPWPLIGRDQELGRIVDLLASGSTRMLTLTGPAGVGKTRLALDGARELADRFQDGLAFVSLGALNDPGFLVPTIGHALGVRESGPSPVADALSRYLRARNLLLVLDNFEHLQPSAPQVAELLAAAPKLSVLVTSRSPLRIRWEQVLPVTPLPPLRAAELFRERALQVAPGANAADPNVVMAICQRLDCLPLAIELAAARTDLLPPPALLARLDQALRIQTGGARDLPARQQTLRHALTWSYDLLSREEQAFFRQLAVFAGGWTLGAAAAIAQLEEATALQLHTVLLDNSLIVREEDPGEPRFGMLKTISAYAAERLEAGGDDGAARNRHAAYFRDLAQASGSELWGPAQAGWLDRLEVEHDNVRLALDRLLDNLDFESFARVSFALWPFWWIRGYHGEGLRCVDRALEHRSSLSTSGCARLLYTSGSLLVAPGRNREVATRLDESIRLARESGDWEALSWALTQRGFVAVFMGRPDLASPVLDEASAVSREHGDPYAGAMAVIGKAHTSVALGRADVADRLLVEIEQEVRELRAEWILAVALNTRGRAALVLGDPLSGEFPLREAAAILGHLKDTWAIRYTLTHLADAAALRGDPGRAALLYGAADLLMEKNVSHFPVLQQLSSRCRAAATEQLGAELFAKTHRRGRSLPLDEAVALATSG